MVALALVLVALALGGGSYAVLGGLRVLGRQLGEYFEALDLAVRQTGEPAEAEVRRRLADLEDLVERLPARWEEFKNEARRAEGRARKIVESAREELAEHGFEHAGVEAQAAELRLVDAGGGGEEAVPAVRQDLESPPTAPSDWRSLARGVKFGG